MQKTGLVDTRQVHLCVDYKLVHSVYFEDRNVAEKKAHLLAATRTMHPWNKHDNGEWFKLTDAEAIEILKEITID